jgi:hypothetical protein
MMSAENGKRGEQGGPVPTLPFTLRVFFCTANDKCDRYVEIGELLSIR